MLYKQNKNLITIGPRAPKNAILSIVFGGPSLEVENPKFDILGLQRLGDPLLHRLVPGASVGTPGDSYKNTFHHFPHIIPEQRFLL